MRALNSFLVTLMLATAGLGIGRTVSALTADSVTPGILKLTATYNSVGVELFFTGDDNANASATLEFKRRADTYWRRGLPLWRTNDGSTTPGRAFYGSALLLNAGTRYDVRVRVSDPNGVSGTGVVVGSITTRANNIRAASTLTRTHYVSIRGNDANSGTSATSAWRTLTKALSSAPAGAVVQVGPGFYAPPTVQRTTAVTLVAQYPAVDNYRRPINAGSHSVIAPDTYSVPSGATGGGYPAPWRAVKLTGPATGGVYTVWKWAGSPVNSAGRVSFAASRNALPKRVAHWDRKSGTYGSYTMGTPAGWAEVLYRNKTYNYGFASFGSDIYVRMPGNLNPNNYYVWVSGPNTGRLEFSGPNIRLSGFEVRMRDITFNTAATAGVVDHNLLSNATITYRATQGTPSRYPVNHTVQYNLFRDTGTWSVDPSYPAIPWNFVKGNIKIGSSNTSWGRV
ncbi:MAG: DUF1565 domain-containing protein, partial [Chloroflexota bacterium]|nr:DUF1565 domain-containing protein [Chloroflexota bacterium]